MSHQEAAHQIAMPAVHRQQLQELCSRRGALWPPMLVMLPSAALDVRSCLIAGSSSRA